MTILPWNLKQVTDELRESFSLCNTQMEKSLWRIYARKDCNRILAGRKPTPYEQAVLDMYEL